MENEERKSLQKSNLKNSCSRASIYIHIPFCTKKCPYCHFFVLPNKAPLKKQLLEGLLLEWEQKRSLITEPVTSIYFGGGTPSLHPEAIEALLERIPHTTDCEITVEYNPENIEPIAGINRISLGVQSFDDGSLSVLGRTHTATQAKQATQQAARLVSNITIDLMYDLPHQTLSSWKQTLSHLDDLPITHLSLYNLTIEPHTPFSKHDMGRFAPPDETSLEMLEVACEHLKKIGLHRYEISAFAKPGYEAVHNTGYWEGRPFLGLGPSAFSHWEGRRFRNHCHLGRYLAALKEGKSPIDFEETLPYPNNLHELLAVRLRLLKGVDIAAFEQAHGQLPQSTHDQINTLIQTGHLTQGKTCSLTEKGRLFYDSVATALI